MHRDELARAYTGLRAAVKTGHRFAPRRLQRDEKCRFVKYCAGILMQPETAFQEMESGPIARLLARRAGIPAAEARVADTLLAEPEATRYESVGELAER